VSEQLRRNTFVVIAFEYFDVRFYRVLIFDGVAQFNFDLSREPSEMFLKFLVKVKAVTLDTRVLRS
jgi:hypothetical protein